jgi:hypothetical protein
MEPSTKSADQPAHRRFSEIVKTHFASRFRKGDVATIAMAGIGIAVIQIVGRLVVGQVFHMDPGNPLNPATIASTVAWDLGLALVLAIMQAQSGGISVYSSVSSWVLILLVVTVVTLENDHRRPTDVANAIVFSVASLAAVAWLHARRK